MTTAERFDRLFSGLRSSFGQYIIAPNTKADNRGKIEGRAATWSDRPLELSDWASHLDGSRGLGICPLADGNVCNFGALDVDIYPLDPRDIHLICERCDLPLILCRTKSGGIHCYAFFSEPVEASLLRERLKVWATLIGHIGCEVFPKQDTIDANTSGNWINIPYFGGESSLRYAYGAAGSLTVEEFLDLAESKRVTRRWLEDWEPPAQTVKEPATDWLGAPPCLQYLGENGGFMAGNRNNGFFNLCIYLRKRFSNDWKAIARNYNQRFFDPPLRDDEVRDTINSVGRRAYVYMCDKAPISQCCNRPVCLRRQFGVGRGGDGGGADHSSVELGRLQKVLTEPPTWRIMANGHDVELTTEEFAMQGRFWLKVLAQTDIVADQMKPEAWKALLQEKLDDVERIIVPSDATLRGQVWYNLTEFCSNKTKAKEIDDLLRGMPYARDGRVYFVPHDFFDYLHIRKVPHTRAGLTVILHDIGLETHQGNLKGRALDYWSVPEPTGQTEPFGLRNVEKEEAF